MSIRNMTVDLPQVIEDFVTPFPRMPPTPPSVDRYVIRPQTEVCFSLQPAFFPCYSTSPTIPQ
jgi:hypothetical protein